MKRQTWALVAALGSTSLAACGVDGVASQSNLMNAQQTNEAAISNAERGTLSVIQYTELSVMLRGWEARYQAARIAAAGATDDYVRGFAQDVFAKAPGYEQQILDLVAARGGTMDNTPLTADRLKIGALERITGTSLDRDYAAMESVGFRELYDAAANTSGNDDADIANLAIAQAPVLDSLMQQAQWLKANRTANTFGYPTQTPAQTPAQGPTPAQVPPKSTPAQYPTPAQTPAQYPTPAQGKGTPAQYPTPAQGKGAPAQYPSQKTFGYPGQTPAQTPAQGPTPAQVPPKSTPAQYPTPAQTPAQYPTPAQGKGTPAQYPTPAQGKGAPAQYPKTFGYPGQTPAQTPAQGPTPAQVPPKSTPAQYPTPAQTPAQYPTPAQGKGTPAQYPTPAQGKGAPAQYPTPAQGK